MKRKELKNFAKKIANAEYIIQTSSDDKVIKAAQNEILLLSSRLYTFNDEDIYLIDEYVQDYLADMT